jgi:hypothetical protein
MCNSPNRLQRIYSHLLPFWAIPMPYHLHIAAFVASSRNNAIRVRQKIRVSPRLLVSDLCCCSLLHRPVTSSIFVVGLDSAVDGTGIQSKFRRKRSSRLVGESIFPSRVRRQNRGLRGEEHSRLHLFRGKDGMRRGSCARRFGHSWALGGNCQ